MTMLYTEPARQLSSIGKYDVVVAGGGFAGVSAALSAARNGAKVCLIEKSCSLGGLGTLGLVVDYLPLCDGNGTQLVGGIGEEIMLGVSEFDGSAPPECWRKSAGPDTKRDKRYMLTYNPAAMELYMEKALLKEGVQILYDTRFCSVVQDGDILLALIVENKSGRSIIEGQVFVDATGDADVCTSAGEAIIESDRNVCAWWFFSTTDEKSILNRRSDNFYQICDGSKTYKASDYNDVSALLIDSHERIRSYLAQNEGMYPLLIPHIPQFRMTRRVVGREVVGEEDECRWFESSIGMTGDWRKSGPRYCIPFGALCPENTANLLVAGRCISTTDSGWDIMRVIPPCTVTGEAAGSAAAMIAAKGCTTRSLCIDALQKRLIECGVIINKSLMK